MARCGWIIGGLVELSLGSGCTIANPAFVLASADTTDDPSGMVSTTGPASSGATSTSGAPSTSGATSTTGAASATDGASTSGATTGSSTGTTGGASTGVQFCEPAAQMLAQCELLADAGLLVCEAAKTWDEAKTSCEAMCGRLAVLPEIAAQQTLFQRLRERMSKADMTAEPTMDPELQYLEPTGSVWLGASAPGELLNYTWLDGTVLPAEPGMHGWGPDNPDYSGLCVVLAVWGKGPENGALFDRPCELPYFYACDTE